MRHGVRFPSSRSARPTRTLSGTFPAPAAAAGGKLEILELEGGASVNEIAILNASGEFVFFMDADILAGAKQNRVVNASILLAPHSKTRVPVSCVEQGRWHVTSEKFKTSDFVAPSSLRVVESRQDPREPGSESRALRRPGRDLGRVDCLSKRHNVVQRPPTSPTCTKPR